MNGFKPSNDIAERKDKKNLGGIFCIKIPTFPDNYE